jgi:uncharacterized protein (TIGR02246 family)
MKRRWVVSGVALFAAALLIMAAAPKKNVQEGVDEETRKGVRALLDKHDAAMTSHDLKAVMEAYVPGPQTVVMGTGPGEMWAGPEEIQEAYKHFFEDYEKGGQTFQYSTVTAGTRGNVAWLSAMGNVVLVKAGQKREVPMNVSAVMVREKGGEWRIQQMHFSTLTGPIEPAKAK